jgi:Outer membrane protein beta-barrel domain
LHIIIVNQTPYKMKTKLTLLILFSAVTIALNAQNAPFYFGLKAAPSICWMKPDVDNWSGDGAKTGFSWGFIAEKNFTENHSLTSGFNMLFNGGKLKFPTEIDGVSGTMYRNYFLKYIEIPVTLKMRTNDINGIRYFGRIGLGTAFKIGSKTEDKFTSTTGTTTTSSKKNYDKVSFVRESLIVGIGGEYELSGGPKLGLELAFNNGFTNILTESGQKATPNFFELAFSVLF